MKYTLRNLGRDILERLTDGADMRTIARWAHNLYLDPDTDISDVEVQKEIMRLIAMEEGPEFEYSVTELGEMAKGFLDREAEGA